MKRFLLILSVLLIFCAQNVFAETVQTSETKPTKPQITFIYIHGSNDFKGKKRVEFKDHFAKQVRAMHPFMMKGFYNDQLIYNTLLKNGEIEINPDPLIFYWGDKSLDEVEKLGKDLDLTKTFSPKVAQIVRATFATCLHDAVWVQKYQNMSVIIDELQTLVKAEQDKGNQVVLLGYSAGSFITYEYFLNKFISLVPSELGFKISDKELKKIITQNPAQKTCLDALLEADIVRLDLYGHYAANPDRQTIIKQYPKLDKYTESACFTDETVKGVINFASPIALFYSEISDTKSDLNFLSKLMYKHILETDIFWLTVNYREDPLGFPASRNLTKEQLDKLSFGKIKSNGGFVYDKSNVRSGRTFISAHLAYWDTQKKFVNAVIKAYNEGYQNLYKTFTDPKESESL